MSAWVDLSERVFSRLTVLSYEGYSMWLCRCACGTVKTVHAKELKNGKTKSCGCLSAERIATLRRKRKPVYACACGNHVFSDLTRALVGLLSPEDCHLFESNSWCAHKNTTGGWAVTASRDRKLHRVVLGVVDPATLVDHRNHNPLDNRRENLRVCTVVSSSQNTRGKRRERTSRFKGVTPNKGSAANPWVAQIAAEGHHQYLGSFPTEEDAARAYDAAAQRLHGPFACTNLSLGLLPGK